MTYLVRCIDVCLCGHQGLCAVETAARDSPVKWGGAVLCARGAPVPVRNVCARAIVNEVARVK